MRIAALAALFTLSACAAGPTQLTAADAATELSVGRQVLMSRSVTQTGDDPLIIMTLTHADGRAMAFEQANHTPHDVMAQAQDGPLAQVMGLFGGELPVLYHARRAEHAGEPFVCAPDGPEELGVYQAPDGAVRMVGLNEAFQFSEREDGGAEAHPYSPDHVCARLSFASK